MEVPGSARKCPEVSAGGRRQRGLLVRFREIRGGPITKGTRIQEAHNTPGDPSYLGVGGFRFGWVGFGWAGLGWDELGKRRRQGAGKGGEV